MPASRLLKQISAAETEKMTKFFCIAHGIAKNNRPFRDYPWQLALHEKLSSPESIGSTFWNEKACKTFTTFIAEAERLKLAEELKEAPFFSVLTDGTTDTSVSEAEIIYVR